MDAQPLCQAGFTSIFLPLTSRSARSIERKEATTINIADIIKLGDPAAEICDAEEDQDSVLQDGRQLIVMAH